MAGELPRVMIWAWERPEDVRFVQDRAGVAWLAGTLRISGSDLRIVRRHQPLRAGSAAMMPVFRIETDPRKAPLGPGHAARAILREFESTGAGALQIDFDARKSERAFYRALLSDLRGRLGSRVFLSITVLASWCEKGSWIESLPVDEAVPMLFRMGPERATVLTYLDSGGDFGSAVCRTSAGISTDELAPKVDRRRRLYVFHPRSWTAAAATPYFP